MRIWNSDTGTYTTLTGHTEWVRAVAWSPDGTHLTSADADGKIIVHDLEDDGTTYLRLMPLTCLAWSAAGIAVGGAGGVVVLDVNDNR